MRGLFRGLVAVASVTSSASLLAQGTVADSSRAATTPMVTIAGVSAVTSLANWPGLALSVNKDAYVTVFAVTRTKGSALPIQILSPARPNDAGRLRAGKTVSPRRLLGDEALHLLNYGGSPLIVAFASTVKPDLTAFKEGTRWGHDLLMDTLAGNDQQMVEILAQTIYAAGAPFNAVVSAPSTITPLATVVGAFAFRNDTVTVTRYGQSINGRIEGMLDPIIMTADVYLISGMLPRGLYGGAPFTLKGGTRASISKSVDGNGYRVTYWPKVDAPPTAAQKAGQVGAGSPKTPPTTPPPA